LSALYIISRLLDTDLWSQFNKGS